MTEEASSSLNNINNVLGESSKSQLDEFYRNNQAPIEKGLETAFKTLNYSLYSIINNAFTTFGNDYEKRLDKNREVHEKAVEALSVNLKKSKFNLGNGQNKKKEQENQIIQSFQNAQNLKKKSQIFRRLNKYVFQKKKKHLKEDFEIKLDSNKKIKYGDIYSYILSKKDDSRKWPEYIIKEKNTNKIKNMKKNITILSKIFLI